MSILTAVCSYSWRRTVPGREVTTYSLHCFDRPGRQHLALDDLSVVIATEAGNASSSILTWVLIDDLGDGESSITTGPWRRMHLTQPSCALRMGGCRCSRHDELVGFDHPRGTEHFCTEQGPNVRSSIKGSEARDSSWIFHRQ